MIEIIPAIDLIDGRCVRLTRGDFEQKTEYSDDPVATAQKFEQCGVRRLHVVDLDGARTRRPVNLHVLEAIAKSTTLVIDYGGGLASEMHIQSAFDAGAAIVNIGSVAVTEPELLAGWVKQFGSTRILLGADVRDGTIAINGWQRDTSVALIPYLRSNFAFGVRQAFVTDIARDGAMLGPATDLYRSVLDALPELSLTASGGVTSVSDIEAIDQAGCVAVIVGKALYEGNISLKELAAYAR